ncbi:ParB/RepB/Spo0J family partition protein [Candidatus Omnitrophota bacterium]
MKTKLDTISPDKIVRNPDNPRLIFRQDELDVLLNSIRKVGIRVPLSVYSDAKKNRYVILDGERRWLCSKKLNLKQIPVVIEPEPSRLENILRMFNIHNVRVQWDLYAIAKKLEQVKKLLLKEEKTESIKDLAAVTGLTQSTVKRAFDLLTLPDKYLKLLEEELKKPKSEQKYSEDFFLEMLKAIKAMERHTPIVIKAHSRDKIIGSFVKKYDNDVITNIVKFREISKIARSEKAGVTQEKTVPILNKLIKDPTYTIESAYSDSVSKAYEKRNLQRDIESLAKKLMEIIKKVSTPDDAVVKALKQLQKIVQNLLNKI